MFTDAHCHLNYTDYADLPALIADCESAGVDRIICAGFDLESSMLARELAEKFPAVYFTAGYHPTELKKYREGDFDKIEELCRHEKCVAVGEIGLDYHYPDTDKEAQYKAFLYQLKLANRVGLPVQIHSRDSAEDTLSVLTEYKDCLSAGALLHCYSYSEEMAERFLKLGAYFSFGGTSTYKRSKKARRCIAAIPADRLLTETDSPYLSPSSHFGEFPNTPLAIPEIAANMAEIKGVSVEEIARTVRANALRLFKKLK